MKIVILGTRGIPANYGGFETCVDYTSRLLTKSGADVTVFNREQEFESHPANYEGVNLRYVAYPKGPISIHTIGHTLKCAWAMRGEQHDLIHVYGVGNAFAIPFLKWGGCKVVISVDAEDWVREKWGVVGKNYLLLAARFATKVADSVIVDSKAIGDVYRTQFGAKTSYVAYGAETDLVDGTAWLDKFGLEAGRYHLFVGRLTPEKRPHTLIEAYKNVKSDMPLVIVGDDRYHQDYIAEMKRNADERVRFVGTVYDDGFRGLCRHSYLYLTASTIEGTSPALLQAMGQGAAVLVNGIPANRETIGNAGFAYDANDTVDLARQWQWLVDNPAVVADVQEQARQRVQTDYTWELVTKQLLALYKEIL